VITPNGERDVENAFYSVQYGKHYFVHVKLLDINIVFPHRFQNRTCDLAVPNLPRVAQIETARIGEIMKQQINIEKTGKRMCDGITA
jgi:hypothetical protein